MINYDNSISEALNEELLGILPLDESDEEYEIKNFYNTHLTPYSYDDFLNLCHKHPNDSLLDIGDVFVEEELNKAGRENLIKAYTHYLNYFLISNYERNRICEALVKFIQKILLNYNESADISNLSEDIGINFILNEFFNGEVDCDIDACCRKAVDTFRFPEFLNNTENILSEVPKLFNSA